MANDDPTSRHARRRAQRAAAHAQDPSRPRQVVWLRRLDRADRVLLFGMAAAYVAVGWATLPDFGMTFDEPENVRVGEALVDAALQGDLAPYDAVAAQVPGGLVRYPPFADVAVAGVARLAAPLDLHPVDAYHAGVVLFGAMALAAVYLLARPFGRAAAVVASLLWATHPLIWFHAHVNLKDIPVAALVAWSLLFGMRWIESDRPREAALFGAMLGLGLLVKPNALLAPLILLGAWLIASRRWHAREAAAFVRAIPRRGPGTVAVAVQLACMALFAVLLGARPGVLRATAWMPLLAFLLLVLPPAVLWLRSKAPEGARRKPWGLMLGDGLGAGSLGVGMFFLGWPLLWRSFGVHLDAIMDYFKRIGYDKAVWLDGRFYVNGFNRPWTYAPHMLGVTTPPILLALSAVGLVALLRRRGLAADQRLAAWTVLLLAAVPLARVLPTSVHVYDGTRHFLETTLALCVLGGAGAAALIAFAARRWPAAARPRAALGVAVAAVVLAQGTVTALVHPYGLAYYNAFAGGTSGAFGDYDQAWWAESNRAGIAWANAHAPPNATVNVVLGAKVVAFQPLRPDLTLLTDRDVRADGAYAGDYVILYPSWANLLGPAHQRSTVATMERLPLVHEVKRLDATVLWVYAGSDEAAAAVS
jgi:hypothetical protein